MEMERPKMEGTGYGDKVGLIHDGQTRRPTKMESTGDNGAELSPLHTGPPPPGKKNAMQSFSLRVIIISGVVFALAVTVSLILTIYLGPPQIGAHAGVVSDVPVCSQLGLKILRKGGNAVDSAVTTLLCVGVVNAHTSGIGGGGFMMIHDHKTHKSTAYDFRETAPKSATTKMYKAGEAALIGGNSIAVPGELRGLERAHKDFGKLEWSEVVLPVADLARNGFNVTKYLALALKKHKVDKFPKKLKELYVRNGRFVAEGDLIIRSDLAKTLSDVAIHGADAFYQGSIAKSIVKTVADNGGRITLEDIRKYKVVKRKVISTTINGRTVATISSPSSGPILLLMLNMMEGFNLTAKSRHYPLTYHWLIETFKFAYAHQHLLADPTYVNTVKNDTKIMISKKYAAELRDKIDNATHRSDYYGQMFAPLTDKGASHVSIIDPSELMVSVTSTLNSMFGSQVMTTDTGIILNDQVNSFSNPYYGDIYETPASPINYLNVNGAPKRPLSSMVPTIVYNSNTPCNQRTAIGGANGTRTITGLYIDPPDKLGVAETLINYLLFDMGLATAIESPRLHNQRFPNYTEYEDDFDSFAVPELHVMGHTMVKVPDMSVVQAMAKYKDGIIAHADSRNGGKVAEF